MMNQILLHEESQAEQLLIVAVAEELFPFFYPELGLVESYFESSLGRQKFFARIIRSILDESGSLYGEISVVEIADAIYRKRCRNKSIKIPFSNLAFRQQQMYLTMAQQVADCAEEENYHA